MSEKHYFNSREEAEEWLEEEGRNHTVKQVCVVTVDEGMSDEELRERIEGVDWISTEDPVYHEYIREWDDEDLFWELLNRIDERGVKRKWGSQVRNYYDFDGYRYWHMSGEPFIVLNREPVEDSTATKVPEERNSSLDDY